MDHDNRLDTALTHLDTAQAVARLARPDPAQEAIRRQIAAAAALVREVRDSGRPGPHDRETDVERRALLKLGGLLATAPLPALERFQEMTAQASRVDHAMLDAAAAVTDALARSYLTAAPADLRLPVHQHLERLAGLQRRTVIDGGRTRLAGLFADAAGFAGVLAADLGRAAEAGTQYAAAQRAAREAEPEVSATLHWLLEAQMALTHSVFFSVGGDPRRSAAVLDRAAGALPPGTSGRASAWVHAHAAKEAAAAGDGHGAARHLDAAAASYSRRDGDAAGSGFYSAKGWFGYLDQPRWLEEYRGKVELGLGQQAAEQTLGDVVARVDDARRQASTLADLMDHHLRQRQLDEAAVTGRRALELARGRGLERIAGRVRGLGGAGGLLGLDDG